MTEAANGEAATASAPVQEIKTKTTRTANAMKPCDRCRAQHLKCVYVADRCQRCERAGHECIRTRKGIQFRRTSASTFDSRSNHNKRIPRSTTFNRPLKFTDETPNLVASHGEDRMVVTLDTSDGGPKTSKGSVSLVPSLQSGNEPESDDPNYEEHAMDQLVDPLEPASYTFQARHDAPAIIEEAPESLSTNRNGDVAFASPTSFQQSLATPLSTATRMFSSDRLSITSHATATQKWLGRISVHHCLDELVKQPSTARRKDNPDLYIETVLLRYFHDELAPWFDLCDPDCHFATVIPQRARESGPLRNALLTISARNLARNNRFRTPTGVVQWNGRLLPQLTEDFAVPYHNECIRDLLQLSMRPSNLQDETLLAAVITLRTDEEMGLNVLDEEDDQQLFSKIASVIIDAQVPPAFMLPHHSPQVFLSTMETNMTTQPSSIFQTSPAAQSTATDPDTDLGASGLRQACFWTALRQELHASLRKKQAVRFPLARCAAFRQLTPAIDAVWTNRMVTFCADVLEFCYGSESSDGMVSPAYTSKDRWRELQSHEQSLCALLPASFEPTFCSEPNVAFGTIFPEIWYLESCHVSGTTYIELARMLLGIFNPTRPQMGHGFFAATNAFISSTKQTLFRLCGIALSNSHCPPSLINACLGITIFGEYFTDPDEQDALLEILALMTNRHAYPTRQMANTLKRVWNREDVPGSSISPHQIISILPET